MSVGFGFSAGDFIAAITVVKSVIDALATSGQAGAEYRELIRELYTLETALIRVKKLSSNSEDDEDSGVQLADLIALQQAAAQCQRTIDDFWESIKKYQPHLRWNCSGPGLKDKWMKVKWAVCKKDDIAKFRSSLVGHTESILLLMAAVQMARTNQRYRKQAAQGKTLASKIQESYSACMHKLSIISNSVASSLEMGKQLLDMTTQVVRINLQVFQIVLDMQHIITRIPGQIERQQPVFLIDALGKASPFHLEFVRSAEALVAILKINFSKVGRAAELIENGDFVIQDSTTQRDIDLGKDWELCFSPGQHVDMSMIIRLEQIDDHICSRCRTECKGHSDKDIECPYCGMNFRRITEEREKDDSEEPPTIATKSRSAAPLHQLPRAIGPEPATPEQTDNFDDEIALIRRVRIPYQPDILFFDYDATTYPLRFPAFSISEGLLTIGHVRRAVAKVTGVNDPRRLLLLCGGRSLGDDNTKAREMGLNVQSHIECVILLFDNLQPTSPTLEDKNNEDFDEVDFLPLPKFPALGDADNEDSDDSSVSFTWTRRQKLGMLANGDDVYPITT